MLEALVINCCKDACRIELTAMGNAGELDNSEYQLLTKSLIMGDMMSFMASGTSGESGYRGGRVLECSETTASEW